MLRSGRVVVRTCSRANRRNLASKPPGEPKNPSTPPTSPNLPANPIPQPNPRKSGSSSVPLFLLLSPLAFTAYLAYESEKGSAVGKYVDTLPVLGGKGGLVSQMKPFVAYVYPGEFKVSESDKVGTKEASAVKDAPAPTHTAATVVHDSTDTHQHSIHGDAQVVPDSEDEGIVIPTPSISSHEDTTPPTHHQETTTTTTQTPSNEYEAVKIEDSHDEGITIPSVAHTPDPVPETSTPHQAHSDVHATPQTHANTSHHTTQSHQSHAAAPVPAPLLPPSTLTAYTNEVARTFTTFRHDVEKQLLADLHTLDVKDTQDTSMLKLKIFSLASDLFEKYALEHIRLSQYLAQIAEQISDNAEKLRRQERDELSLALDKALFEKEKALLQENEQKLAKMQERYDQLLQQSLKSQQDAFQETLQDELRRQHQQLTQDLEKDFLGKIALLRKGHVDSLTGVQTDIGKVSSELSALMNLWKGVGGEGGVLQQGVQVHRLGALVIGLHGLVASGASGGRWAEAWGGVRKLVGAGVGVGQSDDFLATLLDTVPASVQKHGVCSLEDLRLRFEVMRDEVRKSALAPRNAPPLLGQVVGSALASISFAPKGFVQGSGTEETLSRASYFLERGQLKDALRELDGVQGYDKVLMKDWTSLARDRLEAELCAKVLEGEVVRMHRGVAKI